jgi:hypothetical protein
MKKSQPGDLYNKFQAKKKGALKKTGTFKGKSNKLGGGGRFAQLAAKAGGGKKGAAIAAAVGRKKYGKAKFQKMASKGKKK